MNITANPVPAIMAASLLATVTPAAIAQSSGSAPATPARGLQGSYIGITVDGNRTPEGFQSFIRSSNQQLWLLDEAVGQYRESIRTTSGSAAQAATAIGNQFQGRIDLDNSPLSVRGSVFLGTEAKAIMPTLSYDIPVGKTTNIYAGAGYVFVESPEQTTPLGNANGAMLTAGVETALDKRIVIYGDAKVPVNGISADSNNVKFQFGAGYRF